MLKYEKVKSEKNNHIIYHNIQNNLMVCFADYDSTDEMAEKYKTDLLFTISECGNVVTCACVSKTRRIRALEVMDYVLGEYGTFRGNENSAYGKMSSTMLNLRWNDEINEDCHMFFLNKLSSYFEDTIIIDCMNDNIDISDMEIYYKKHIPWAYVKTVDIGADTEKILVKSLENTTGIEVPVSEDTYIMIGSRGEVYDISREKFEKSYEITDVKLNIFENDMEFIPTIETIPDGEYIAIDEMANICYPKEGAGIYAKKIDSRIKIFGINSTGDYFVGKPGDFLAVRFDDHKDAYIIKHDIFKSTYNKE